MLGAKLKQGATVIDYSDRYYSLNTKGKDKIKLLNQNPPLSKCKAGRRLAQRENKKVLDFNKANLPHALTSVALGLAMILSL